MKTSRCLAWTLLAAIFVLPMLALAQATIPDPANTDAFLQAIVDAITGGQWRAVVVLAAVGAVYLLRTFGTKIPGAVGTFLGSNRGGAVLALLFAVVSGLGAMVLAGKAITFKAVLDVLLLGFTAIGGWVGVRRLLGLDIASQAAAQFTPAPTGTAADAAAQLGKPPAP